MQEARYRNKYFCVDCIFSIWIFTVESHVITVSQKSVIARIMVPYLRQVSRNFIIGIYLSAFCHVQRTGNIPVVYNTSVLGNFQVVIDETEMHVVFIAEVVGKKVSVEQGCRLVHVFSTSIYIVDVESESQSFVCIDGKISLETLFSVRASSLLVVSKIGERRFGVGIYHVFRFDDGKVVRIEEKELLGVFPFEEDMRDTRGTQVSQVCIMTGWSSRVVRILKIML